MLIQIDPMAEEPIFEQIAFQVKGAVARAEVAAGDRLPSVRDLAKSLAVNPNTVVKAYDLLHHEGVIVRRQGAGCFVTGQVSALRDAERRRRLQSLMQRTVTEAFHLGFGPQELRDALESALQQVRFHGDDASDDTGRDADKNRRNKS